MDKYERGLGLYDNPFQPRRRIPGVHKAALQRLDQRPLQLHHHPQLLGLFSEGAGLFRDELDRFRALLNAQGYVAGETTDAFQSMLFLIVGPVGSGKTTLVSRMLHHVQQVKLPDEASWSIFAEHSKPNFRTAEEVARYAVDLEKDVNKGAEEEGYCCIAMENLILGSEMPPLTLWENLIAIGKTVLLFLTTSDDRFLDGSRGDVAGHRVERFACDYLQPEQALAFVGDRIGYFRGKLPEKHRKELPAWLDDFPLFPFEAKDIKTAVLGALLSPQLRKGKVTLREFAPPLASSIEEWLFEHGENFRLADIDIEAVERHHISIIEAYERKLREARAA